MNDAAARIPENSIEVCRLNDLVKNSGVCALVQGQQVALFYVPTREGGLYALSNWDPLGRANVLSRGIIGDIGGEVVVASPLYKQHFRLEDGRCLEDESVSVPVYGVHVQGDRVLIDVPD